MKVLILTIIKRSFHFYEKIKGKLTLKLKIKEKMKTNFNKF